MEKANDPLFQEIMSVCESKHIKELMAFQKDWNKEVIAQFYATVHFGHLRDERAMFWMTEEQKYHITFSDFVLYSALVLLILIFPSCMMRVSWR